MVRWVVLGFVCEFKFSDILELFLFILDDVFYLLVVVLFFFCRNWRFLVLVWFAWWCLRRRKSRWMSFRSMG